MRSSDALVVALDKLEKDDFYDIRNQPIFDALGALFLANTPVDSVTLIDRLTADGRLGDCGGRLRLLSILEGFFTDKNVAYHAKIVKDNSIRRKLGELGTRLRGDAYNEEKNIEETIAESENKLLSCAGIGRGSAKTGQVDFLARFDQQHGQTIFTGIEDLDRHTGGLNRGEPCIIAARPSVGKTSLALQICRLCCGVDKRVIFYTYETTKSVLEDRLVVGALAIDRYRWKTRRLMPDEMRRFAEATTPPDTDNPSWGDLLKIQQNLLIDDSRPDVRKFALSLKLHKNRFDFDLVILDYIQKLAKDEDNQAVAAASMAVSDAAAAHNVPVIALSQLRRTVKGDRSDRYDPRPTIADLRGSGALEQDARVIGLLWNKCAPLRMAKDLTPSEEIQKAKWAGKVTFILAKSSETDTAEFDLSFDGKTGRFNSLDTIHKEQPF